LIGIEIEQLRDVIESTLSDCGMRDVPWYCTKEPSSRQGHSLDRRPGGPCVRVVWKWREKTLEFFNEREESFRRLLLGDGLRRSPGELSAAGAGASPA